MGELTVVMHNGKRVLTTQQLAEAYGADKKVVAKNYERNKNRYILGKHYIALEGDEKLEFLNQRQIDDGSKNAKTLYLWTEKGAFLHAKSLNTDVAWEVYDRLVDSYFNPVPKVPVTDVGNPMQGLSPQLQLLINMEMKQKEQDLKLTELENRTEKQSEVIQTVKDAMMSEGTEENFSKWVVASIEKIASSSTFMEELFRYQIVWGESYKRLTDKASCNLDTLLKNAKKRAAENGATKSSVKNISKLSIIGNNKRLRELYISCLKEMLVAYCMEVA